MKIVKASVELRQKDISLEPIDFGGRISHRSETDMADSKRMNFIQRNVVEHGDWSIVEHVSVSVLATMDRGCTHEWVRHRLMSFTQESTRFVNYEKKMPPSFIYPKIEIECPNCLGGDEAVLVFDEIRGLARNDAHFEHSNGIHCVYNHDWLCSIWESEEGYRRLIRDKWRPQEARSVFPNALASKIMTTANLRSWRHLLLMRTTKEAHPQIKEICIDLLKQFQQAVPLLFDDIEPEARQIDNMRKPH